MAFTDSQYASTFSLPMRWNSRRSRGLGLAPAASMRAVRIAITWGTTSDSSAALLKDPAYLRLRGMCLGYARAGHRLEQARDGDEEQHEYPDDERAPDEAHGAVEERAIRGLADAELGARLHALDFLHRHPKA